MPYKSRAQQRYMHAAASRGDIAPSVVEEFDKATKDYSKLPEHAPKPYGLQKPRKKRQLKTAFDRGYAEALEAFGVEKTASDALTRAVRRGLITAEDATRGYRASGLHMPYDPVAVMGGNTVPGTARRLDRLSDNHYLRAMDYPERALHLRGLRAANGHPEGAPAFPPVQGRTLDHDAVRAMNRHLAERHPVDPFLLEHRRSRSGAFGPVYADLSMPESAPYRPGTGIPPEHSYTEFPRAPSSGYDADIAGAKGMQHLKAVEDSLP